MERNFDWKRLRRYAWKAVRKWLPIGSEGQREDLVSAALEHLFMVQSRFIPEGQASFYTWAYRVMENRIVDELRKSSREYKNLRTLIQLGITPPKPSRAEEFQIILR